MERAALGKTGRVADNIQLQSVISECVKSEIVILGLVIFSPFNDVTVFYWVIAWSQTLLPLHLYIFKFVRLCGFVCVNVSEGETFPLLSAFDM
jgi:hypothetical protein